MQIKDYFTFQFKKPDLEEAELSRERKKKILSENLEQAYSRLESIEILNSNSKTDDMFHITSILAVDLYNISAEFYGLEKVSNAIGLKDKVDNFPDDSLRNLYKEHERLLSISNIEKPTEEEAEVLEEQVSKLLTGLEKYYKKGKKDELHTPLDDFKKRWTVQGSVLVAVLVLTIGSVIQNKLKYPTMTDDKAQLYFLTKEKPNPTDENSVKLDVSASNAGKWQDLKFDLPTQLELVGVRFDPINQRKVRINMERIQYLDEKGAVLFERDFQLGENLIPKDIEQIGMLNDIKAGRAVAGGFAEMVSTGSDPFFHLELPPTQNVSSVKIRVRMLEEFKKFED